MKKKVILIFFIALTISSCEKQEMYDQLYGSWQIFGVSGSILGSQPVRDFDIVTFGQSGKYSVSLNDTIIQGGSYHIQRQPSKKYGEIKVDFLLVLNESFNNHPYANFYSWEPFDIIFYGSDTLTLSQVNVSDGFNYHFKRK